jgi:ABC-type polysaccharide/polyol phosphate export permease
MMELTRFGNLVKHLALRDLGLKYRGSIFGVLWSLANPLCQLAAYTLAFKYIMRHGPVQYPFFLLTGLLPWTFFVQSLLAGSTSVVDNSALVKKLKFPLETLPVSSVAGALVQLLIAAAVFLPLALLLGGARFSWSLLALPPLLALHILFTSGLCLSLSAGTVFFRDIRHFVESSVMVLFWLTPVVYDLHSAPAKFKPFLMLNPMTLFTDMYQDVLYRQVAPSPFVAAGAAAYTVVALVTGILIFGRLKPRFAELL